MFIGRKDAPSISCQDSCQHLPASLFFFFGHLGLCPQWKASRGSVCSPGNPFFHHAFGINRSSASSASDRLLFSSTSWCLVLPRFHPEPRLSLLPNQPGSLLLMSFGWMVFTEQTQQGGISLLLPEKSVRKKIRVRDQQYSECFLL